MCDQTIFTHEKSHKAILRSWQSHTKLKKTKTAKEAMQQIKINNCHSGPHPFVISTKALAIYPQTQSEKRRNKTSKLTDPDRERGERLFLFSCVRGWKEKSWGINELLRCYGIRILRLCLTKQFFFPPPGFYSAAQRAAERRRAAATRQRSGAAAAEEREVTVGHRGSHIRQARAQSKHFLKGQWPFFFTSPPHP